MRLNIAVPEANVAAPVLDAALESVTRLNESLLKSGSVPTFRQALKTHNIRWKPEPPGAEHFDHLATVIQRGWGDCDDLAPAHAASLRHTGEDPGAKAVVRKSGPHLWHAIVRRSDGTIDDPSREAGMSKDGARGRGIAGGAVQPLMPSSVHAVVGGQVAILRPSFAWRPIEGVGYEARVDLPFDGLPLALSALHMHPGLHGAILGAIDGALETAQASGCHRVVDRAKLAAVSELLDGADIEDVRHVYGDRICGEAEAAVGSFFGSLAKLAKKGLKFAAPLAKMATPFIPGVGPLVSPLLNKGLDMITQHGGGGGKARAQALMQTAAFPGGGGGGGGGGGMTLRCVPI